MRQHFGKESGSPASSAQHSAPFWVLVCVAIGFALRALWLALNLGAGPAGGASDGMPIALLTGDAQSQSAQSQSAQPNSAQQVMPNKASPSVSGKTKRLTAAEYAMLTSLCPVGIDQLPAELLPTDSNRSAQQPSASLPVYRQTAARAAYASSSSSTGMNRSGGRITGLRIASRPAPAVSAGVRVADNGWLVAPELWYGPDGLSQSSEPSVDEAVTESADAPPAASPINMPAPSSVANPPVPDEQPSELTTAPALSAPDSADQILTSPLAAPVAEPKAESNGEQTLSNDALSNEAMPSEKMPTPKRQVLTLPSADFSGPMKQQTETAPSETSSPLLTSPIGTAPPVQQPVVSSAPMSVPMPGNLPAPVIRPTQPKPQSIQPQQVADPSFPPQATSAVQPTMMPSTAPRQLVQQPIQQQPRIQQPIQQRMQQPVQVRQPLPTRPVAPSFAAPSPSITSPLATSSPNTIGTYGSAVSPHAHNPASAAAARKAAGGKSAYESHRDLYLKNNFPSARDCAECHQKTYDQWSTSSHAYAYVSPMFHAFEQTITDLSQGTVGHFCVRCHAPVAEAMNVGRTVPVGQLAGAQREGVTCVVCHRVNERYGKNNGERRIVPGGIEAPVYGGIDGHGIATAIANREKYKIKTSPTDKGAGQLIHNEGRFFDQLTHAEACASCHQVAVHPGIKLEVVWEQYRASPACKKGTTCQDCHMGRVPGVAAGYTYGSIATVGGKSVNNHRKQSNHSFYGPGYSIAHPGVFPQHKKADRWTVDQWLEFDWRAGWGTDDFEERIEEAEDQGADTATWFPATWSDPDDRYDAREIVEDNQKKLAGKRRLRELVMENGSKVDGPFFREPPRIREPLEFDYIVANLNEGHNFPTASLGAQPQLWANVVLIDPDGRRIWETGYTDSKGDLCDIHSVDVRHGRAPFDAQLFNLQTMFMITGATGTDREFYLPVNFSFDQVPQLRPGAVPYTVLNHPPFIRMESRSLAPLGKKQVKYKVPAELMRKAGRYRLSFRLRNRMEPLYFMRFCESTQEMIRSMSEQTLDIHPFSVEFEVR